MRAPVLSQKRAKSLRRRMSPPAAALWIRLRARHPDRPNFRREHPVGPYIIDFYCAAIRLAVEVDGQGHDMGGQPAHDIRRSAWLAEQGVDVLRIPAVDVMRDADGVSEAIWRVVRDRMTNNPHP